jgi:hypothetical protein
MIEADSFVTNTISTGTQGPDDLYLTFTFEWNFPAIQEGSQEAEDKEKQLKQEGVLGISYATDVIRAMVRDGKL